MNIIATIESEIETLNQATMKGKRRENGEKTEKTMKATFETRAGSPGYVWATMEDGQVIELYPQYDHPVNVAKKIECSPEEAKTLLKEAAAFSCRPVEAPKVEVKAAAPSSISEAELDAKMRQAGFEAAGNAAGLWNQLNPVNGRDF